MPVIKPTCIRDMKLRINVVDVISRVAALRRAGARFKGLCPFHQEKTPSFNVDPDKGYYKCFGCGKSGDIFTFVRETEQLTFTEAVEALGQRFNVPVEFEEGSGPTAEQRSLRQEIFEIHDLAADHYHNVTFRGKSPTGEFMRQYWLEKRRFAMEVAEDFKIGAAAPTDDGLVSLLLRRSFSEEALRQCGLLFIREDAPLYPGAIRTRFRGRLMIPIRDHQGRVVAFTARQTDLTPTDDSSAAAKYVNSPETPIFSKSHLLFNLDRARSHVNEANPFVLVEGQLDAIRCWSVGLKTAVAPQGTSITEPQLTLLHRYSSRVECFFDSDSAGQKAALRFLPMALKAGLEARFLTLKGQEKLDPDLLFLEQGLPAYQIVQRDSLSAMGFACRAILPEPRKASPEQKARCSGELIEIVLNTESEVARAGFIQEIAEHMDMPLHALERDYRALRQRLAQRASATAKAAAPGQSGNPPPPSEMSEAEPDPSDISSPPQVAQQAAAAAKSAAQAPKDSPEQHLLLLLLHYEQIGKRLSAGVPLGWIDRSHVAGQLLARFLIEVEHDNWPGRDNLDHLIESSQERTLIASLLFDPPPLEDPVKVACEGLKIMRSRTIEPRLRKIELDLARLRADSPEDAFSLIKERSELQRQLRQPIGLPAAV